MFKLHNATRLGLQEKMLRGVHAWGRDFVECMEGKYFQIQYDNHSQSTLSLKSLIGGGAT